MDTVILRDYVAAAASADKGRVWPNGLGFDTGGRWSFRLRDDNLWEAVRPAIGTAPNRYGVGATPAEAKTSALSVPRRAL